MTIQRQRSRLVIELHGLLQLDGQVEPPGEVDALV